MAISMKQIFVSVFLYYSTFSSEEKDFVISQVDVIKMLKDLKLISNSSKKGVRDYEIDILFKKVRKIGKILVSREFLNLLVLFQYHLILNLHLKIINFFYSFYLIIILI